MATVNNIRQDIANHLKDPLMERVQGYQLLECINAAADDAFSKEWVLPVDNESLETASATFEYNIPAGVAFIHQVWLESSTSNQYDTQVLRNQWRIQLVGSQATLVFDSILFTIVVTRNLKLVGHKRPTVAYATGSATIDVGMEAFIRERATSYAARYLARSVPGQVDVLAEGLQSNTGPTYAQLEQDAWLKSENLMENRGAQYRITSRSRFVPGL